jgi:hypothetical protein
MVGVMSPKRVGNSGGIVQYFFTNFSDRLLRVTVVLICCLIIALIVGLRSARAGSSPGRAVARVFAVGFAVAAMAATTTPGPRMGGGFEWAIGSGGLSDWRSDVERFPDTIQSVLLVGNVLIYMPVGFCAALGWPRRLGVALLVTLTVPALLELSQGWGLLRGHGATDDFLLNALGVLVGWSLGAGAVGVHRKALARSGDEGGLIQSELATRAPGPGRSTSPAD